MSIKHKNHAQFELFPETAPKFKKIKKERYLLKDLTLSVENIIVLSIVSVMMLVVFFSYGVERGKKTIAVKDSGGSGSVEIVSKIQVRDGGVPSESFFRNPGIQENVLDIGIKRKSTGELKSTESSDIFLKKKPLSEKKIVEDGFTIQVASFKLEKNAEKEALRLKGKGHNTFVLPKGSYSIVCVGKFAEKIQAQEFSNQLKDRYRDLLVRRF